jgi:predicted metalloprotease with PDZ domain
MLFTRSTVDKFENNTLDGIYKGMKIEKQSVIHISNSTFMNFLQNEEENDSVQSLLYQDGSAIGMGFVNKL